MSGTLLRTAGLLFVIVGPLMAAAPARAELTSDAFLGFAITSDAPYRSNGVKIDPTLTCLALNNSSKCSSAKSPAGGLRVGYWIDPVPWLGVAADFSAFVSAWGVESPIDSSTISFSALVTGRIPLVKQEGFPNGRVQPYLAVGPGLFIASGSFDRGSALLDYIVGTSTARFSEDTSVKLGVDGRAGVRLLAASWFAVFLEYRYTYFEPTWKLNIQSSLVKSTVKTDFSTNHVNLGIGVHY